MSIEKIRTKIVASIWQALAQSEVDVSAISNEDQEKLVRKIADAVIMAFDAVIDDEYANDIAAEKDLEDGKEDILWKGRPFLSVVESYVITDERIKIIKGMVARKVENFELIRIQDIDYKQNVGERIFGLGDIFIQGHDASDPTIVLRNVAKPEEIYELLRKAWLAARKRHGLQFREYM